MSLLPFLLITFVGSSIAISFEGYQVYEVIAKTESENVYLKSLETNTDFDFWSPLNKIAKPVTVMVAPNSQKYFEESLTLSNIKFNIVIKNVESTMVHNNDRQRRSLKPGDITFEDYLRHDEINAYLEQLAENYPDVATVETIGQSYEGRDMKVVRISSGSSDPAKPVLFIDAGIHAREWIAPATALFLVNQLVENPEHSDLIANVDWIILPSVNPDGYEFSWGMNRLWRKTRSEGESCIGCDANRNFGWHWMEAGASDNECSETYGGSEAFSEIESQNVRDFLDKTENIQGYLSLHSFGQYVLYPWSYADVVPDNADVLQTLGENIRDAIAAVNGTVYTVGSTTATLYAAAGASHDWAVGGAGIPIAYTLELPGGGFFGFDMPKEEIKRVVAETFDGLKTFGLFFSPESK